MKIGTQLRMILGKEGYSKAWVARHAKIDVETVTGICTNRNRSIKKLDSILEAIGYEIVIVEKEKNHEK